MKNLPVARTSDLVVQYSGNEVLIYDLEIDKAYCLNETSTIVYQSCDGKTNFEDLRAKSNFTDEIIYLALDGLKEAELLDESEDHISPFNDLSRRAAIRKIATASVVALPVIASLVAPSAVSAQSCKANGQSCNFSAECCSRFCNFEGGDICA